MATLLHTINADSTVAKSANSVNAITAKTDTTVKKASVKRVITESKTHSAVKDSASNKHKPVVANNTGTFSKVFNTKEKQEISDTISQKNAIKPVPSVIVAKPKVQPQRFFSTHELKLHHTNPMPLEKQHEDWMFFSLLLVVGAFTLTKVLHARNMKQMRDAFFSTTISNQIIRDENLLFQRASMFLTVVFYLATSLLLYHVSVVYNWDSTYLSSGFGRFFIFLLLISLIYSVKLIVLKVIGFILKIEKPVTAYIFNVFLVNNIIGILLIPVLIALSYMDSQFYHPMLYISFVLTGCAYLFRLSRGMMIGIGNAKFSPYYIILYLCTLEIAPLVFFAKLLVK